MTSKTETTKAKEYEDGVYGPKCLEVFAEHGAFASPDKLIEVYGPDSVEEFCESSNVLNDAYGDVLDDVDGVYEVVEEIDAMSIEATDNLMNCDCDEQIEVVDSYIEIDEDSEVPILNTIFMCAGCGHQVRVEAAAYGFYDIDTHGIERL